MANPLFCTLFLILSLAAAIISSTPTTNITATAVNSTLPTTNTTTVNSTIPTTNSNITATTVNSTIPCANSTATAVNSTIPCANSTATAVNSTIPTTNSKKHTTNTTDTNNSISPQELDILLGTLRSHGYPLFSNAIHTSDVQFQILYGNGTFSDASSAKEVTLAFTIFAPRDHFLYTLDMASDADAYVAALRYHVVPSRRFTIAELHNLSSPYLETLLPHYSILVGKNRSDDAVTVDGVRVSDPNLYLGSRYAVHGLDGILLTGFNMYVDTLREMGKGLFAPGRWSTSLLNLAGIMRWRRRRRQKLEGFQKL